MNRTGTIGVILILVGLAGYVAGIATPYPGRAFSLTALMAGVTLAAIGRSNGVVRP